MGRAADATVLIVDDDEPVADIYASQLSERYDVRTAYGGRKALDRLSDNVDLVLLDRRLDDLSGRTVLERIRERDVDCGVLMLTAVDPGFEIADMDFDDYLRKPVRRDELESTVAGTLDRLDRRAAVREYLAVASKVATLRVEYSAAELAEREEYDALLDDLADLRERVDVEELPLDVETQEPEAEPDRSAED